MSWIERAEDAAVALVVAVVTSSMAAGVWVVRRVFTNEQQIAMLKREIEARDDRRTGDRKALDEVKTDVRELRSEIRQLFREGGR
ncbi:MAG: septal ring factor EnvC (AmiA/AmiB activator) [Paracoccaceae bacterium]|jgi:septal ring factor EnvC (AmiA/AmiB activator)